MNASAINNEHYQEFRHFLEESCGIVLGDNKQYLVASRLSKVLAQNQISDLGVLVKELKGRGGMALRGQVIEAMTTNETSFFRDIYPFDLLKEQLFPELQQRRVWQARIWSAASSSGQEAYSISMALQEFQDSGGRMEGEIVGTDISPNMVQYASRGQYSSSEVARGLSPQRLQRFFQQLDGGSWALRPEIKRRASFRVGNLLESYSLLGRFDLVFCRNVLIYFSSESRRDILKRIAKSMKPGGYLIVGASESLSRQADEFEMVRCRTGVVYRLKS